MGANRPFASLRSQVLEEATRRRLSHVFESLGQHIENDVLTERQTEVVVSIEQQYRDSSMLSKAQIELLENILRGANQR